LREGEKQKAAQTVQKGAFEKGLLLHWHLCKKEPLKKGLPLHYTCAKRNL